MDCMGFDPHHKIATLQKHWADNAIKDEQYNLHRASEVKSPVLRNAYLQEARWDKWWADRRLGIAKKEERH
jgi:hypothetical protein